MCIPIENSVPKSLKMSFLGKIGKSGRIEKFFKFSKFYGIDRFVMSKYTSCPNFVNKYWILRKLHDFLFLFTFYFIQYFPATFCKARIFFPFLLTRNTVFFYQQVLLANAYPCGSTSSFFSSVLFHPCRYRLKLVYKY